MPRDHRPTTSKLHVARQNVEHWESTVAKRRIKAARAKGEADNLVAKRWESLAAGERHLADATARLSELEAVAARADEITAMSEEGQPV